VARKDRRTIPHQREVLIITACLVLSLVLHGWSIWRLDVRAIRGSGIATRLFRSWFHPPDLDEAYRVDGYTDFNSQGSVTLPSGQRFLRLLGRNGATASNDPANAPRQEHGQYSRQPPLGQRRYRTLDATASQRMIGQRAYISVGHRPHPVMARQEVGDTARAGQVWIGVYPRHI
jgi:hypothetical protein